MIDKLYNGILEGDRSALSQSITLIESHNEDHNKKAIVLLEKLRNHKKESKRLGISGTPGVGKSTFIEKFGNFLIDKGHKVAVLAIDPTSYISGGSILGDKTRMKSLSYRDEAFVRPTPSSKYLGGVAKKTRETIELCEAFGFDYIIVETVGVGQSEVAVSDITDHLMLLMQPASGDELQGIKRGILELANSLVVNKADGDLLTKAKISKAELESSLHILRKEKFPIFLCSALYNEGIEAIYENIESFFKEEKSEIMIKRRNQIIKWAKDELKLELIKRVDKNKKINEKLLKDIDKKEFSLYETIKSLLKDLSI